IRQRFNLNSRITEVANHCITSINTLTASFSSQPFMQSSTPLSRPTSSQSRIISHIYQSSSHYVHACRRSIVPPFSRDGSQSDGSFDSLSLLDNINFGYSDHSRRTVVPLIASRVSLPSSVGSAELMSLLPPELTLRYNDPSQCLK